MVLMIDQCKAIGFLGGNDQIHEPSTASSKHHFIWFSATPLKVSASFAHPSKQQMNQYKQ